MRATSSRVRLALAFGAPGLLLLFPTHASAQAVDPSEIVKEKLDQVEEVVEEAKGPVEEALKEVEEKAGEVVGEGKKKVGEVVGETVGNPNPPVEPGPPTNEPSGGNGNDPAPTGTSNQPQGERRPPGTVESVAGVESQPSDNGSSTLEPVDPRPRVEVAPVAELAAPRPDVASPPVTPGEAAQRLAFPILMACAVLLYLLLQGRFDRRDPKLLFDIDVDTESLSFE